MTTNQLHIASPATVNSYNTDCASSESTHDLKDEDEENGLSDNQRISRSRTVRFVKPPFQSSNNSLSSAPIEIELRPSNFRATIVSEPGKYYIIAYYGTVLLVGLLTFWPMFLTLQRIHPTTDSDNQTNQYSNHLKLPLLVLLQQQQWD